MNETVLRAIDALKRWQWEESSGTPTASQSNNCGPTCITFIAGFYKDTKFGIEQTRRMITGCCAPTNSIEQTDMLIARGVPAAPVWIDTLSQIDEIVGNGNHPMVIGVQMSRVPPSVRDHPFLGWHALVIMGLTVKGGVPGYWVMDPNFSPPGGYRSDPDRGMKFYPRSVMQYAYIQNTIRRGIVPLKSKPVYTVGGLAMANDLGYDNEVGKVIDIRANKPMRAGAMLTAHSYGNSGATRRTLRLWGSTTQGQTVEGSRLWYFGSLFVDGKQRVIQSLPNFVRSSIARSRVALA